jgi:hypothetical protein
VLLARRLTSQGNETVAPEVQIQYNSSERATAEFKCCVEKASKTLSSSKTNRSKLCLR